MASLALVASLMAVTAAPVAAASRGAYTSSSTEHYLDGNVKRNSDGNIERVQAELYVPRTSSGGSRAFSQCSPDDGAGMNGPTVFIGIEDNAGVPFFFNPHVQAGLTTCVRGGSWGDSGVCDGTLHFFSEWKSVLGASIVRDLGPASYDTNYTFMIDIDATTVEVFINGVEKTQWSVGTELNVSDDLDAVWLVETHDADDGLGFNESGSSTNIGSMKYRIKNSDGTYTWWNRSASCGYETPSSQVECRNNGSYDWRGRCDRMLSESASISWKKGDPS